MCMGGHHSPPHLLWSTALHFAKEELFFFFFSYSFSYYFVWFIKLCFAVIYFLIVLHSVTANMYVLSPLSPFPSLNFIFMTIDGKYKH